MIKINMQNIFDFIIANIQHIYYVLSAIAIVYTFSVFIKSKVKDNAFLNFIKLILEVPNKINQIKDLQHSMFYQTQLQNTISNCILESLEIAQMVCDKEGKCIKVNSKWISLTGLSESEASGHNWLIAVYPPAEREHIQEKWNSLVDHNSPFEEIFLYQHRITKQITKVKCTATNILDENGKRIFILGLSRVIGQAGNES